ncbi:MAG: putative metal-binding motif-containing protein [Archangium sp.]|nr:putative metal-binding motif-containing protein [Archangium sp.]
MQGVQRCVNGTFETACPGEVTAVIETCNAIDDDCDGSVDDGVLTTFYVDRDGDGFGSSTAGAETRMACSLPAGFSAEATDCDDGAASINPGGTELCDAAEVDENCNGAANEGCGCSNIGLTQGCCAGRGSQTCEARDAGGGSLSACTVMASTEVCNGVDDDCDGQTDESLNLEWLIDAGIVDLDGGCSQGLGACTRFGAPACVSSSLVCDVTAGTPGAEICNAIDDDCDGQTDEVSATLCAVTGQLCTGGTCACPTAQSVCGSSCQSVGGSCSAGTGACTRQGSVLCTNGAATCDAVAGTPGIETCNNIDDDCDGQTDETSATLCPATGQTCSLGTCACPSGQTVCGTSCQTLGGTCSVGVGACNRTGAIACISGGASCNATAGSPVAETCDGIDNDCDGTNDNGVTITCYPDGDNDQYATAATTSQQCPDPSRAAVGYCPTSYVAPSASLGIDCDVNSPTLFRLVSTRSDADSDTFCAGTATTECVGANAPSGRRFATSCAATDDCDDANASLFRFFLVRADSDADGYCTGASTYQCAGNAPLVGTREWTTCQVNDDCNDMSAAVWVNVATRADADGDSFCVGVSAATCIGSSAPAGRRLTGQCTAAPDDCNDANSAQFTSRDVRVDADNDQYCVGAVVTQCSGSAPLPGTRGATSCLGEDCRDTNSFATTTCSVPSGFTTVYHTMACGIGLPGLTDTFVPTNTFCPTSFSVLNLRTEKVSGAGTCSVVGMNTLRQTCTGFDASNCRIVGDCTAN